MSYTVLLLLAARLILSAWEAVETRRADLGISQAPAESAGQIPVVAGEAQLRPDLALATAVGSQIAPANGTAAVYVKQLATGRSASINDDRIYPTASLFKIPILVELLRQRSAGLVDMDASIQLQQKYWAEGSGVLQAEIGNSFKVRDLVDLMIGKSDNIAALALLDLIGTDNVNLTLQANGLDVTRLRIGWPQRNWGGPPGDNTTTAREMGTLFEKIAVGSILNPQTSQEGIRILSQQQQVAWLPARLPSTTRVAHKSGELIGVRHDAGVVYAPSGPFVVVVLTEGISDYDQAASSIAGISRAAYDYFESGRR